MKQFFTLTILITLFNLQSIAQENTGRISGLVTDMNKKQVEAATVALLRSSDSLQVKSTLTDQQGAYCFEGVPAGGAADEENRVKIDGS